MGTLNANQIILSLFVKHLANGKLTVLIVYCEEEMVHLKQLLSNEFEIKDLGQLGYFLGMEVERSSQGISISQRKYVLDLLKETRMIGCRPIETPIDPNTKLEAQTEGTTIDRGMYQHLVGKLIY